MSHVLAALLGLTLLVLALRDAFETIVLPRRVERRFRITAAFYFVTWTPWRAAANRMTKRYRESTLSWYGPVSLLMLIALWAFTIVLAFGILHWSAGSALKLDSSRPNFGDDLYLSGTTFFTLGMGDVVPRVALAKVITVIEAGIGFAFLAVVIGYLPVIYQAFSRRELAISLLDARAGSPPSAGGLLWRHRDDENHHSLVRLLADWERWSGEVLESHLSYPALAYFRSQHSNQSWLAALTTMLDTSALVVVGFDGWCERQAHLTFAMARHAAVDLAQVFSARRPDHTIDRLPAGELAVLLERLREGGMVLRGPDAVEQLAALRAMYEPYVTALSEHLQLPLPGWNYVEGKKDNWEGAPWKLHDKPDHPEHPHF